MPYIDIGATRAAARRVGDAGEDVRLVGRGLRLGDCAAELQGSRTLSALEPLAALLDLRIPRVAEELHTVAGGMGDLADRTATAVGEAP